MRERVLFFDLLRCVAAVAVIAIHVLAPYRNELGVIPMDQWLTAVGVNSVTRWAVPVFILITGALMLSDTCRSDAVPGLDHGCVYRSRGRCDASRLFEEAADGGIVGSTASQGPFHDRGVQGSRPEGSFEEGREGRSALLPRLYLCL